MVSTALSHLLNFNNLKGFGSVFMVFSFMEINGNGEEKENNTKYREMIFCV